MRKIKFGYIKKCLTIVGLVGLINIHSLVNGQININTIDVKNRSELMDFFSFNITRSPLISAHRGGGRPGFPENCMATFENTLQYTPAIFEIDPRLTKDSVIVLMHDNTLDRTTTGTGKLSDYTWEELGKLNLKDSKGEVTPYKIPLLSEVIEWGKGKTIFVLDDKDVPYHMVTEIIQKHNAFSNILMTVRTANIARQFYKLDERFMFSAYVFDMEDVEEYESAEIPWSHVMAYIGSKDIPENIILYEEMNERGVKCMISGAPSLDKEFLQGNTKTFDNIFYHGADVIETDIPIRAALRLSSFAIPEGDKQKYFGKMEIPLEGIKYLPTNKY